uniref:Ig-like domain-containing protein n=1 Tax=Haplochromis burtoni TaxID=8153 RepID=A0A3Q2VT32_HAPBU
LTSTGSHPTFLKPRWIFISGSEVHTVTVQPGEDVTLQCSNISTSPTHTEWFRVINATKTSCISSMFGSHGQASFCNGFQNGKFDMSSNVTSVFLKMTEVGLSDVGLYFCGFYVDVHIIISNAVELKFDGKLSLVAEQHDETFNKNWKSQSIIKPISDDLNYAAMSFQTKLKRSRRPATHRELESHVVYAATR